MGILCLNKIDELLAWREKIHETYKAAFADCSEVKYLDYSQNRAYCPILFKDFETRERVYTELKEKCNVFARRYFYPLLIEFVPYIYAKGTCPIAEDIARRVLTLPTYYGMAIRDAKAIAQNIKEICL
jgi:dTDP-4-amino-4,6-dideoxygalactose transaminase